MLTIDDVLGRQGLLAKSDPRYEFRPAQIEMAKLVNRGLLEHVHVMVEAGTGTGKSFGYLVPALLSGQRVVISTATLALQEQLLQKDIPHVLNVLDSSARVVQLKGRNNYLCRDKLEQLRSRLVLARSSEDAALFRWADRTPSGDKAELDFVPPDAWWREVDADADDCIMEGCEFFGPQRCHQMHAREAARHADIIVVNHALFFADMAAGGGIIPPYDYAVLDEAHQIEDWATAAFASSVSKASVGRLQQKLNRAYVFDELLNAALGAAAADFAEALADGGRLRYPLRDNVRALELLDPLQRALYRAENWVAERWSKATRLPNSDEDALKRRRDLLTAVIVRHTQTIERLRLAGDQWIAWAEHDDQRRVNGYAAHCAPASIATVLRERLFDAARSVVMTSATISTGGDFSYLRRQTGLDDGIVDELVLESPFDFARQAMLYLPPERLNPKRPDFLSRAARVVASVLRATSGRAFVLFTSTSAMQAVASELGPTLPFPFKVQGQVPKGAALRWFREEQNPVLFATASFWEGVDVVGSALSCVIIDRLPFPPPDDPIISARSKLLMEKGEDAFQTLMVPVAVTKLKQGLGRLIRSANDRGLMCILDGRLETMSYGRRILAALPPARRVHDLEEVTEFLGYIPANHS
ncbi:MAG: helicase [Candidatus Eremiobacter antarcticus]|nr:ATP-dependent DNA helicase [Candidatus Eremiobacteraeota bacterium]MBC5807604.1 ATP-dependent DNA helicase [Candidatus Eremiobacteraeota bacterium]PZR61345.1 MAG: helicase [Candidatus Eremiobacter sp. RRmetagenome_bin22]